MKWSRALWLLAPCAIALIGVLAPAEPVRAQQFIAGMDRDLRVEWEQRQKQRGAVISGYVYNANGTTVNNVRVLIEGLDASGQPVSSTIGYVFGTVPAFGRTYFEVRSPSADSYRVKIVSYDWLKGGGGGGGGGGM